MLLWAVCRLKKSSKLDRTSERHQSSHTYWAVIEPWPNRYVALFCPTVTVLSLSLYFFLLFLITHTEKKRRNLLRCLLLFPLPFGVWNFALSLNYLLFFHQPHFSCLNSLSLQNFLFSLSLAPAAWRLSLSFTPSQYCPTNSVIYEPQEAFVPLKAVMSCFSIQRWKKYPDVLLKIVKVLKLKYFFLVWS